MQTYIAIQILRLPGSPRQAKAEQALVRAHQPRPPHLRLHIAGHLGLGVAERISERVAAAQLGHEERVRAGKLRRNRIAERLCVHAYAIRRDDR
jgi:hypothetical protein